MLSRLDACTYAGLHGSAKPELGDIAKYLLIKRPSKGAAIPQRPFTFVLLAFVLPRESFSAACEFMSHYSATLEYFDLGFFPQLLIQICAKLFVLGFFQILD